MILYNQLSFHTTIEVGKKRHIVIEQWRNIHEDERLRVHQYTDCEYNGDNKIFLTIEQAELFLQSLPTFIEKAKLAKKPTSRKIKVQDKT